VYNSFVTGLMCFQFPIGFSQRYILISSNLYTHPFNSLSDSHNQVRLSVVWRVKNLSIPYRILTNN